MSRDIDFAAVAVKKAIVEKFERKHELGGLIVTAGDRTIVVRDGEHVAEGSRDALLAGLRKAQSYDEVWVRWSGL